MRDITAHCSAAVSSDEQIRKAMEHSAKGSKTPSTIIPSSSPQQGQGGEGSCGVTNGEERELYLGSDGMGPLYHGGYMALMSKNFMQGCTSVVNTARGLEIFGPKYLQAKETAKQNGVAFLEMNWNDDLEQVLSVEDLTRAVRFIHSARQLESEGGRKGGTLVHCAQGKSRSTAVVLAYVMARAHLMLRERPRDLETGISLASALAYVQEQRAMAEPNGNFWAQLEALEKAGAFECMLSSEGGAEERTDELPASKEGGVNTAQAPAATELAEGT